MSLRQLFLGLVLPLDIRSNSKTLLATLVLWLMAVFIGMQLQSQSISEIKVEPQAEPWSPALFKFMTVGHWPLGLDSLWMRTLQDTNLSHVKKGEHPWTYYDYQLITELDPAFGEVYHHGAIVLAVIRNDALGALDLLNQANEFRKTKLRDQPPEVRHGFWQEEWQIPLRLAYVHLFELDDLPSAAVAFQEAAALPGAPQYLMHLSERFKKTDGQYEVGLRLLKFMFESADKPEVKEKFKKKFELLSLKLELKRSGKLDQHPELEKVLGL